MVTLQLPLQPVKSTAGMVTRQGSPVGILLVVPPLHGSDASTAHFAIRAFQASLTGPELPLLPVSVEIVCPIEKVAVMPPLTAFPRSPAPFPTDHHCQLPGAPPITGVNFTLNGTDCPGTILAVVQGAVHCMPSGNTPLTELTGKLDFAAATATTLYVSSP